MARKRMLSPEFFTSRTLARCSPRARLLFAGLWTLADRDGRLENIPKLIEGAVFPHDSDVGIGSLLNELARAGCIARYFDDAGSYIAIPAWAVWQRPHVREKPSRLPAPPKNSADVQRTGEKPVLGTGSAPEKPVFDPPESESESESESDQRARGALARVWGFYVSEQARLGYKRKAARPTKDIAPHLKARLREHSAEDVLAVIEWAHRSEHRRAVGLREGPYLGATLFRASKFAEYLAFAESAPASKPKVRITPTDELIATGQI